MDSQISHGVIERHDTAEANLFANRLDRGQKVSQLKILIASKLVLTALRQLSGLQLYAGSLKLRKYTHFALS
jgi:hypothetical protein